MWNHMSSWCKYNHVQKLKVKYSWGPLHNQTWQTEWKTAPLAKVQLSEYKNQTLELLLQLAGCMPSLTVQWPTRIFHFIYCAWLAYYQCCACRLLTALKGTINLLAYNMSGFGITWARLAQQTFFIQTSWLSTLCSSSSSSWSSCGP